MLLPPLLSLQPADTACAPARACSCPCHAGQPWYMSDVSESLSSHVFGHRLHINNRLCVPRALQTVGHPHAACLCPFHTGQPSACRIFVSVTCHSGRPWYCLTLTRRSSHVPLQLLLVLQACCSSTDTALQCTEARLLLGRPGLSKGRGGTRVQFLSR